jgi:serine/threonine-protein kinase RsbW
MNGISLERPDLGRHGDAGELARIGIGTESLAVLTIPADKHYVAMARMTALHVAGIVGLPIGRATDLRLAVDEACGLFLDRGRAPIAASAGLTVAFTRHADALRVSVSGPAPARRLVDDDLGWTLLCALGGEPRWETRDGTGTLTLTEPLPARRG